MVLKCLEGEKLVYNEGKSISAAARALGLPRSTLSDHINGTHSHRLGRSPVLSQDEEDNLVAIIRIQSRMGNCLTPQRICELAQVIYAERVSRSHRRAHLSADGNKLDVKFKSHWWSRFHQRHALHMTLSAEFPACAAIYG